jgi:hypothetical protein
VTAQVAASAEGLGDMELVHLYFIMGMVGLRKQQTIAVKEDEARDSCVHVVNKRHSKGGTWQHSG